MTWWPEEGGMARAGLQEACAVSCAGGRRRKGDADWEGGPGCQGLAYLVGSRCPESGAVESGMTLAAPLGQSWQKQKQWLLWLLHDKGMRKFILQLGMLTTNSLRSWESYANQCRIREIGMLTNDSSGSLVHYANRCCIRTFYMLTTDSTVTLVCEALIY